MDECMFEHIAIETNGVRLHVAQAGPADGRVVLLLHGFPEFWRGWARQAGALVEAGFRVVIPDQRGYNLSDKPEGVENYRVGILVKDMIGLLDALGCERVLLAGHDWGAMVAWEIALRSPERVEKLVIANVPHPAVMQRFLLTRFKQMLKSWYILFFQIPGLPEWLLSRGDYAAMRRMMVASAGAGTFSEADLAAYSAAWRQPGALKAMIHWYRAAFRGTVRGLRRGRRSRAGSGETSARRVKAPTLILWGMKDVALSHEMAVSSIEYCQQGELVFFKDATHWVQHDEAEAVGERMVSFYEEGF